MTNTQETVLGEVSGSEQPQEEVQFTELRPVEQSRIKDTSNDKDPGTTDGLKVLRSITEETQQGLNPEDFGLVRKIDLKEGNVSKKIRPKLKGVQRRRLKRLVEEEEDDDDDEDEDYNQELNDEIVTIATRKSERIRRPKIISSSSSWSDVSWSEISDSDAEAVVAKKKKNKKPNSPIKKRRKKNKDFLKDEVYYYRQNVEQTPVDTEEDSNLGSLGNNVFKDMANNFSGGNCSAESTEQSMRTTSNKKRILISNEKGTSTEGVEKDLRLKIGVIIQSNYRREQENNNVDQQDNNESSILQNLLQKGSSNELTNPSQSSENNISETTNNKNSKDQTTCTREDKLDMKKYCCLMCDAKFKGSGGLRNHWKVMHGSGPLFKCDDCGKEFPLKERLKLHVRTHTGFKPYKCSECDKSFARGGQLAQHRRTHSHVKPYHCTLCSGTFTCAANLALHMKRHNGQKDHKCGICGREFIRRDALKKHLECLHKDVKSFLCIICNKTFKGHLPQHMRTHCQDRPHGCATCGQRFAQKSQLTVHQRTHSGQRPFRCLVCWQAFAHSTALKLHTRRHTGERPFKCNVCNAGFTQLPHWKKHMKCIHGRSKPYSCKNCNKYFKMKNDLESHEKDCGASDDTVEDVEDASESSLKGTESHAFKAMPVEKMRLLLAVLLKRISKPEKLSELGFGKRLIDEILRDSLEHAGKEPARIGELTELETLRKNLEMFLEWTVPKEHWEAFKKMNKSPEEILETLTAT